MKSEILIELEQNYREMGNLIREQKFYSKDAERYLARYFNVLRAFEDLVKSRDRWKQRYLALKNESSNIRKGEQN